MPTASRLTDDILRLEAVWKDKLLSRDIGLNEN